MPEIIILYKVKAKLKHTLKAKSEERTVNKLVTSRERGRVMS